MNDLCKWLGARAYSPRRSAACKQAWRLWMFFCQAKSRGAPMRILMLSIALAFAGCARAPPPIPVAQLPEIPPPPPRQPYGRYHAPAPPAPGAEPLVGLTPSELVGQFGKPNSDRTSGTGRNSERRMDYLSGYCLLRFTIDPQVNRVERVSSQSFDFKEGKPIKPCIASVKSERGLAK